MVGRLAVAAGGVLLLLALLPAAAAAAQDRTADRDPGVEVAWRYVRSEPLPAPRRAPTQAWLADLDAAAVAVGPRAAAAALQPRLAWQVALANSHAPWQAGGNPHVRGRLVGEWLAGVPVSLLASLDVALAARDRPAWLGDAVFGAKFRLAASAVAHDGVSLLLATRWLPNADARGWRGSDAALMLEARLGAWSWLAGRYGAQGSIGYARSGGTLGSGFHELAFDVEGHGHLGAAAGLGALLLRYGTEVRLRVADAAGVPDAGGWHVVVALATSAGPYLGVRVRLLGRLGPAYALALGFQV